MAARNGVAGRGARSGRRAKAKAKPKLKLKLKTRPKVKSRAKVKPKLKSGARRRTGAVSKRPALGRQLAIWAGGIALAGIIALVGAVAYLARGLPDIDTARRIDRAPSVTMVAGSGEVFARFGGLYGEAVVLDRLPADLLDAVLATEDRRFYRHFGIDPAGLARAAWANWRAGRVVQGGSTIT